MKKKTAKIFKLSPPTKKTKPEKTQLSKKEIDEILDSINEELDFLPEDSILYIPFLIPLYEAAGLTEKQIQNTLFSDDPAPEDIHILQWGIDVGYSLIDASLEDDDNEWELIMEEAVDIAADYVPRVKSRDILIQIETMLRKIHKESGTED